MNTQKCHRIDGLERSLRRVRTLNAMVFTGWAVTVVASLPGPSNHLEVVRAKKFEVVGDDGKAVGGFMADPKGNGLLQLMRRDGSGVDPGGGGAVLARSKSGRVVAAMGSDSSGRGVFEVKTGGSALVASLTASESGSGVLLLKNRAGKPTLEIGADSNGGLLSVVDNRGETVVELGVAKGKKGGRGKVTVLEPGAGRGGVQVTLDEHGDGLLRVKDKKANLKELP